jgi:putative protease
MLNQLRRDGIAALESAREQAYQRPPTARSRASSSAPQRHYGPSKLDYRGNVYNDAARDFFLQHGVEQIDPAYECNQEGDEVPLMICKHCLRYSLNQCPLEQGPGFKPDPLVLKIGNDSFRLKFDCKRCEMHVLGCLKTTKR